MDYEQFTQLLKTYEIFCLGTEIAAHFDYLFMFQNVPLNYLLITSSYLIS